MTTESTGFDLDAVRSLRRYHRRRLVRLVLTGQWRRIAFRRVCLRSLRRTERLMKQRGVV